MINLTSIAMRPAQAPRFGRVTNDFETQRIVNANTHSKLTDPILKDFCFVYGDAGLPVRLGKKELFKIPLIPANLQLKRDIRKIVGHLERYEAIKRFYNDIIRSNQIIPHNIHFIFKPGLSDEKRERVIQTILNSVSDEITRLKFRSAHYSLLLDISKQREWKVKSTGETIVQFGFSDVTERLFDNLKGAAQGAYSHFYGSYPPAQPAIQEMHQHLDTLGIAQKPERITKDFLETQVKPEWKKLVKKHHTDTNQSGSLDKIQTINAAYTALKAEAERNG